MSTFALKILAMCSMLVDHTAAILWYCGRLDLGFYTMMRALGRIAMPVFCWFIVVGLQKSSDRVKYFQRLCLFALLSQLPFSLALSPAAYSADTGGLHFGFAVLSGYEWLLLGLLCTGCVYFMRAKAFVPLAALAALLIRVNAGELPLLGAGGNVYYDLALGLSVIWYMDEAAKNGASLKKLLIGAVLLSAALFMVAPRGDYGWKALALIVPLWLCRESKPAGLLCVGLWGAWAYLPGMGPFGVKMFLGVLCAPALLAFYNGKKGASMKYVFYAFYPLHLMLLFIIARFVI